MCEKWKVGGLWEGEGDGGWFRVEKRKTEGGRVVDCSVNWTIIC